MAWASKRGARPKTRSSTGLPSITEEGCIRPWTTRAPWRSRKIGVASKKHWRHKSGAMGGAARGQGQTTESGGPRGYDGGKKIMGRKRQMLVDTEGTVLKVKVHPADIHDKAGGMLLLFSRSFPTFGSCGATAIMKG